MIKQSTLSGASTLASQLDSQGLVAVAKPNTPLNELVNTTYPSFEVQIQNDEQMFDVFSGIEAATRGTLEDPSQHSLQADGLIRDISKVVSEHISFAKNTVKPLVVEYAQQIEQYLTTQKPKQASELFEIVILDTPTLVKDESFLDTLKPYVSKTILEPDLRFNLGPKTTEELLGLITFGYERTDKLVLEWLSTLPEDFVLKAYTSFFTNEPGKAIISYDDITRANVFDRLNFGLAILLLATKLFDNVDETAKDTDLRVYRNTAAQYRDFAGALVTDALNKIALMVKTERLVLSTSLERYQVKVVGEVYRPWLQQGGAPEVILGYIVSNDTTSSKVGISNRTQDYLSAWNSFLSFYNTSESNKAINYFKDFLTSSFNLTLKEPSEVEKDFIAKNPNYYTFINELTNTYVQGLKKDDMKDVYAIALTLVAKHRFYYTASFNILNDINEAGKVNPNVDVREAALLAAVNYVTDYFASQISLGNGS